MINTRAFGNSIKAWHEPVLHNGYGRGLGDCNAGLLEPQLR